MKPSTDERLAAMTFRDSLDPDYQNGGTPLWHGWAIFDAFLAGIYWERNRLLGQLASARQQDDAPLPAYLQDYLKLMGEQE